MATCWPVSTNRWVTCPAKGRGDGRLVQPTLGLGHQGLPLYHEGLGSLVSRLGLVIQLRRNGFVR